MARKIYEGYLVLVATFICRSVGNGLYYSGGLFLPYLCASFNIGTTYASLYTSLYGGVSVLSSFLSGYFQDLLVASGYSVRPVFFTGTILIFCSMTVASYCTSFLYFLLCSIFMGIGIGFTCWNAPGVLSLWFTEENKRDQHLLLANSGSGIGSFVYAQAAVSMLSKFHNTHFGECMMREVEDPEACAEWRPTFRYLAAISSMMLLISSYFMREPAPSEVLEYEKLLKKSKSSKNYAQEKLERIIETSDLLEKNEIIISYLATDHYCIRQLSFKEAIKTKTAMLICLWSLFMSMPVDCYFIFVPLYSEDIGLSSKEAGLIVSVAGIAILLGNLSLGFIADLLGNIRTLQLCMVVMTISMILLPFCKTVGSLLFVSVIFGQSMVSMSLYVSILADVYAKVAEESYFSIVGLALSFQTPGVLIGPILVAGLIEYFGYYVGFFSCAFVFFMTVVIVLQIPNKERQLQMIYMQEEMMKTCPV